VSYIPPSPTPATPSLSNSNRTLWIILGSIGFVGICMLLCTAISVIGALTMLGRQTSTVFSEIENELNTGTHFELPTTQPIDVSGALTVGESKRLGDLEFTITSAQAVDGDASSEPAPFYQFLAVRVQITNRGAQPVALEKVTTWTWLQDTEDFTYDCCVFELSDETMFAELAPGSSVEGKLIYEAPDDTNLLYWVYEDETGNDAVVVKLEQLTATSDVARARR
jgi:hypothetical protein